MGLNYNKITQQLSISTNNQQILNPEISNQINRLIFQIEQVLSKYKGILINLIKKANLLSPTDLLQWNKLYSSVVIQTQYYRQQSLRTINNMYRHQYCSLIDRNIKDTLKQNIQLLFLYFMPFRSYVQNVKSQIQSPRISYCSYTGKPIHKKLEKQVYIDKDINMNEDEIGWEEKQKINNKQI